MGMAAKAASVDGWVAGASGVGWCHDLPNEHSMALTRPVQCLHALVFPGALHTPFSFPFFFLPRRRNVAQLEFPQTAN
jgi:hypothetical protein